MPRFATLKDICSAGYDLRLWCYACARAEQIDAGIWRQFEQRGWPIELEAARRRFRCRCCQSRDDVLIVPGRPAPSQADAPLPSFENGADMVAWFYHHNRALKKKRTTLHVPPAMMERLRLRMMRQPR
ncbi:hypothetical protein [Sphingomonas oryzagri]|uniref:Zinc-ribbon domain-containing protein n=1 Tax=Sphingomonas oryzagri TaxID=3042314 RepID=A0ABT6N5Y7_9SPHN|nr:hypothetical protein [Sphingomonas oryzagri]MDH7640527.1 hypothetical protein [Sphingomonas oryzagri]